MTELTYIRGKVDLSEWGFVENDRNFGPIMAKIVGEALEEEFTNTDNMLFSIWFAYAFDDEEPVDDPLMLGLELPLCGAESGMLFRCSLSLMVDDFIEACEEKPERLTALANSLRELADKLEQYAPKPEATP